MSHWNYRVTKRVDATDEDVFEIREVYYNNDGEVWGWTENPASPHGENFTEISQDMHRYLEALGRPVLDLDAQTLVPLNTVEGFK